MWIRLFELCDVFTLSVFTSGAVSVSVSLGSDALKFTRTEEMTHYRHLVSIVGQSGKWYKMTF